MEIDDQIKAITEVLLALDKVAPNSSIVKATKALVLNEISSDRPRASYLKRIHKELLSIAKNALTTNKYSDFIMQTTGAAPAQIAGIATLEKIVSRGKLKSVSEFRKALEDLDSVVMGKVGEFTVAEQKVIDAVNVQLASFEEKKKRGS
jgi:hypothetical protein